MSLTPLSWHAKYPFSRRTFDHLRGIGFKLEDVASADNPVVERALGRINEAIERGVVEERLDAGLVDAMSFLTAAAIVSWTGEPLLMRRYALAEAKRAGRILVRESLRDLISLASNTFRWSVKPAGRGRHPYEVAVHVKDYLRNAVPLRAAKWKLVNRLVDGGYVYVTKGEAARLLEVEVERLVTEVVSDFSAARMPDGFGRAVEEVKAKFSEKRPYEVAQPLGGVEVEAFPPCMKAMYSKLRAGAKLSHMERFSITAFLIGIGMDLKDIFDLFTSVSDFDERLTWYQIRHIAGQVGGGTKYSPPKCETLKTHGLCVQPDRLCGRIRHPISYYRIKVRGAKRGG